MLTVPILHEIRLGHRVTLLKQNLYGRINVFPTGFLHEILSTVEGGSYDKYLMECFPFSVVSGPPRSLINAVELGDDAHQLFPQHLHHKQLLKS